MEELCPQDLDQEAGFNAGDFFGGLAVASTTIFAIAVFPPDAPLVLGALGAFTGGVATGGLVGWGLLS